ncbi:NOTCH2 [Mytilus coruscus]|uniref:NOTCH2 n=1 Tax=Mytilus coruscus TaxID=42192 RepID=A0A6J8E6X8_MYTCO|nr:NOTCH2 [Mytilus coruscus]
MDRLLLMVGSFIFVAECSGLTVIRENQCSNGLSVLNVCICHHGWTGSDCSIDVDECSRADTSPCGERGTCVNTPGSFHCDCKQSYVGVKCELKLHGSNIRKRLVLNSFATPPAPTSTVKQTTNSPPPFTTKAPPTPKGIKTPQPITEQQVSQATITTKAPPPIG